MHFKFNIVLFALLILSGCKSNSSGIVDHDSVENRSVDQNDEVTLLSFIKETSFDFRGFDNEKLNVLEDSYEGNVLLLRVFIETDGTGTLGWIQVDFNKAEVRDITVDPEEPKILTFDVKKYTVLKKKYHPETANEQNENIACTQIETDNVFENPITEKCECNSGDIIQCYTYFYQNQQDEYKSYLLAAIKNDLKDTTVVHETKRVITTYKLNDIGLTIFVSFDGGEDKYVFYKKKAHIVVDHYSYPD